MRLRVNVLLMCMAVAMASQSFAATIADVEAAIMNKEYAQARDLSDKIIKNAAETKSRAYAKYYWGLAQLRLGQNTKAREAFSSILTTHEKDDLYEKAALGLIEGLSMAGFYKEALAQSMSLLKNYPRSSSKSMIYLKIARANQKLSNWAQAKEYLHKIIDQFPQSLEAPLAKGLLEEKEFFAVQVGSFKDKAKALELVDELKSKKQYAYMIETAKDNGEKYYRVRVGQTASLEQAQAVQSQLSAAGYPSLIYP